MAAIFLSFVRIEASGASRGHPRATSQIEEGLLCPAGIERWQNDNVQINRPSRTVFSILKDRQLPAQELSIDAGQFAWLQGTRSCESLRETAWLMASTAAKREKEERTR